MADSLILKGVKDVRKHTGTDLLLRRPKGGGDQWKLKRWWINGQVSTQYCTCTVFDVGGMKLALNTSPSSIARIDYADDGTFSFYGVRDIDYAALFTEDFELIEYYVMPRLAGGQVMTVTPADGADRPTEPAPPAPPGEPAAPDAPFSAPTEVKEPGPKSKSKSKKCD